MVVYEIIFALLITFLGIRFYRFFDRNQCIGSIQKSIFFLGIIGLCEYLSDIKKLVCLICIATILFVASVYDSHYFEIPDSIHVLLMGCGIFFGLIKPINVLTAFLLIMVMIILIDIFDRLYKKEGMGGGDIKLFLVTFMYFDLYHDIWLIMLACIFGILIMLIKKVKIIAFCPAISLAMILILLI